MGGLLALVLKQGIRYRQECGYGADLSLAMMTQQEDD